MRMRATLVIALAVLAASSRPLVAQQATGADMSGTWVINFAKSDFGMLPRPTIDSTTMTRAGAVYQIETTSDFGGQGIQHLSYKWPVGDGETTNDLASGATIHTTTKVQHDTTTFSSTISVQGQTVALQTGRSFLSPDGKTLTREMEMQPLAGPSTDPMRFRLVYDRR
jgi:hypothetical protein